MTATAPTLSGVQRAAVLVIALGVETASRLLPELSDDELERISVEVARIDRVPGDLVAEAVHTFHLSAATALPTAATGGLDAARAFLREGLDETRAQSILPRVEAATPGTGFDLAAAAEPAALAAFLAGEHPQAAAVVLSRLAARPAADALARLPEATRSDVIRRLSTLVPPPASALGDLDAALRRAFGPGAAGAADAGVKRAADILTQSGRATGRAVMDALKAQTPDLAGRIESLLFVFDDLVRLDDRDLGRVLAEVDQSALACALHGADAAMSERVLRCVSERVGAALLEEIEMIGSPETADVDDAQRAVVGVVLSLAEAGTVTIRDAEVTT